MCQQATHEYPSNQSVTFFQVASKDKAVPPWFGRRMARHLQELFRRGVAWKMGGSNGKHGILWWFNGILWWFNEI